jgi:uncharacterized protein
LVDARGNRLGLKTCRRQQQMVNRPPHHRHDGIRVDAAKAKRNPLKRGVDFVLATKAFDDSNLRRGIDPRRHRETRYQAIGSVNGVVPFVAHTMRGKICRIIGARRASRRERQAYSL